MPLTRRTDPATHARRFDQYFLNTVDDYWDGYGPIRGDWGVVTSVDTTIGRCVATVAGESIAGIRYNIKAVPRVGNTYLIKRHLAAREQPGERWLLNISAGGIRHAWWHLRTRSTSLRSLMPAVHYEAGIGAQGMIVEIDTDFGGSGDDIFETLTQDGVDISGIYVGPGASSGVSGHDEYFARVCPSATPGIYYVVGLRQDTVGGGDGLAECKLYRNSAEAPATFVLLGSIPLPHLGERPLVEFRAICADPHEPDTVYVGGLDQFDEAGTIFAMVMLKTTNAGASWTQLADPIVDQPPEVYKMAMIGCLGNGHILLLDYAPDLPVDGYTYSRTDNDGLGWTRGSPTTTATPPVLTPALTWTRGDWHDGEANAIFPVPLASDMESVNFDGPVAVDHYYDFYYAPAPTVDVPDPAPVAMFGPNWVDQAEIDAGDDLTPPTLSGDANDYNPAGYSPTTNRINLSASVPVNFTGLTGGAHGRLIFLFNVGTEDISLTFQDTASARSNRLWFLTGLGNPPIVIGSGEGHRFRYDATFDDGAGVCGAWMGSGAVSYGQYSYNGGLWYLDPTTPLEVD